MRTAIVSDLHLGSGFGEDVLRDAEIRRVLLDELAGADKEVPGAPLLPKPVWGDRLADAVKAVMTFRMW